MDDLSAKLNQVLSDPESMKQIMNIAASLGLGGPPPQGQQPASQAPPPPPQQNQQQSGGAPAGGMPDLSALAALLGGASQAQQPPSPPPAPPLIDPQTLGKIVTALSRTNNGNDKNIQLLRALKPHFSDARGSKVDDAIRIIQLLSLLPVIRESGLLSGLFGGDKK